MRKLYKFRFYPTAAQEEYFRNVFGSTRWVYNKILTWRYSIWETEKRFVGFAEASRKLTELRSMLENAWLAEIPYMPLQQAVRDQDKAYTNFFKRRAKKPTFRTKRDTQTIRYCGGAFYCKKGIVRVAKLKQPLKVKWSRELPSTPTSVHVTKEASGRYYITFTCEVHEKRLPDHNTKIGIDVGITTYATLSTGEKVDNPRHLIASERKLKKLQKKLSRQKKGSSNHSKTRARLAKIHAKIRDSRCDFIHKLTRRIVNENQVICIESLRISSMVKNHKLAKHIQDATWGAFVVLLTQKAKEAGRQLYKIGQYEPSSKKCHVCGSVMKTLPLSVRMWDCPSCQTRHDRDTNAALNILHIGLPWANAERFKAGLPAL